MRAVILSSILLAAACTPHNRKPGLVIGGVMAVGGSIVGFGTPPDCGSDIGCGIDGAMTQATAIGAAVAGATIFVIALATGDAPKLPRLPPPATAARD